MNNSETLYRDLWELTIPQLSEKYKIGTSTIAELRKKAGVKKPRGRPSKLAFYLSILPSSQIPDPPRIEDLYQMTPEVEAYIAHELSEHDRYLASLTDEEILRL